MGQNATSARVDQIRRGSLISEYRRLKGNGGARRCVRRPVATHRCEAHSDGRCALPLRCDEGPALAAPFDCAACYVLLLLRRLVLIGLAVLLLVLLNRLLILLGSLAGLQGIRGLVWLGGSNVDSGRRISFAIQPGNISGQACKLCS